MKFESFDYRVSAKATFTRAEYTVLIKLAKAHYDAACVAAGLAVGEAHPKWGEGRANGFLAQLRLFPTGDDYTTAVWPFSNFDTTLKILEQRALFGRAKMLSKREAATCDKLNAELMEVCDAISAEHRRLTEVRP